MATASSREGSFLSEPHNMDEDKRASAVMDGNVSDHNDIKEKDLESGVAANGGKEQLPAADVEKAAAGGPPNAGSGAPIPGPNAGGKAHVSDMSSIPNGGLLAWLQVIGSFFLFFNTWGIVNTYGVYQTYYAVDILKDKSESTIAWIGSVQIFLLLLVGTVTGPIYDSGGFRPLLLIGSFLIVFGHMMLSLCKEYWQILLAQAFCIGIGVGCLFIPSVAILSTYFSHRLALATGLAASGSSLGGVLYPIILNRLYPRIGFGWTVRVIGFITLATLLVPNLVMKVRVLPPARRKMIDTTAFTHSAYMTFCIGSFIVFLGLFQPFFFVEEFAIVKRITDENLAFYLLSILNAASVFGRILPNMIADKSGPMNVIVPCTLASGALILGLIGVKSKAAIIVVVLIFGFMSGSLVSLPPTIVVHLTPDRRFIGTRLGMYFLFIAIGALVGSPVGGAILNHSGFSALWIFGGVLCCAGGVVMGLARGLHKGWGVFVKA